MSARAILLTGVPGSGKSTLARALARELRVPYLARDDVRGGLLFTAGAWGSSIDMVPSPDDAVEVFLDLTEHLLRRGVSCVLEYVVRAHRPQDLERILAAGDCRAVRTRCAHPDARLARRNRADRLIANPAVLRAAGFDSVDEHTSAALDRLRRVEREMFMELPVPVLEVDTTDSYRPCLDEIVEFATSDGCVGR